MASIDSIKKVPLLALALLSAASCLERKITEAEASFSADRVNINVASENKDKGFVADTLTITANRSWTAEISYDAASGQSGWVSIDPKYLEHENIGRSSDIKLIPIVFNNNRYNTTRTACISFHYEGQHYDVNVSQGGITYRLQPSVTEINDISDVENIQKFSLDANIPWIVRVREGATADVEVLTPTGEGPSEIQILVKDNKDFIQKDAVLVIEGGEGFQCEPVTVSLNQCECTPYLNIDTERSLGEIVPLVATDTVFFSTNGDWIAHLENASDGISLEKTSGTNKENFVVVNFGENFGSEKTGSAKTATIVLESNGLSDEITVTQKYWWQVKLVFHNGTSLTSSSAWPLLAPLSTSDLPASSSKAAFKGELKTAPLRNYEGISLSIFMTSGMWRNSNQGFDVKGNTGDYVEISAVEGMTLAGVAVTVGAAYFRMELADAAGNAVKGGEYKASGWATHERQYWILSGTQPSTAYRWAFATNSTSMLHILEYFYK